MKKQSIFIRTPLIKNTGERNLLPVEDILTRLETDAPLSLVCELDRRGFPPAPGDTPATLTAYIRHVRDSYAKIETALAAGETLDDVVGFKIGKGVPIGQDLLVEAAGETDRLFGFGIDWVPAYYLSDGLGLFWGGCTVVTDESLPLFFIRKDFENRRRWFIYDRCEILSHELCHVARSRLEDLEFEEHFAYMTARSPLRRFMGNCFRREFDALLFVGPVFLLLAVQILAFTGILSLPEMPFAILAALGPLGLMIRNLRTRRTYARAEENLRQCSCRMPRAVLFRLTAREIREIARSNPVDLPDYLRGKADSELRWRVIAARFLYPATED